CAKGAYYSFFDYW
nr:immunoglobulin heavy chain junction region [Mus musculus]